MMTMNIVDWFILIVFFLQMYYNFRKGFANQLFSLLGIIIAFYIALNGYEIIAGYLTSYLFQDYLDNRLVSAFGFLLLFALVNFFVNYLGGFCEKILNQIYLSLLNQVLGVFIGLMKAYVFIALVLWLVSFVSIPSVKNALEESQLASYIARSSQYVISRYYKLPKKWMDKHQWNDWLNSKSKNILLPS